MEFKLLGIRAFFFWPDRRIRGTFRFFTTRCANFIHFGHPFGFVQVPWFWSHAAIESRGYDRGWNDGYEAGSRLKERSVIGG